MDHLVGSGDPSMRDMLSRQDDSDLMMHDLGGDMLPFDLDLNSIPEGDVPSFSRLTSAQHQASSMSGVGDSEPSQSGDGNGQSGQNAIGAGPLPASYGVQMPQAPGSTLTEFTKRRNWSQRVIEELKDFLHILSPDGRILYVSPSTKALTGHEANDLVGKVISDFIHPDDSNVFVREFNESIASGHPLRFFYRFRKADNSYVIFESHGHPHIASEAAAFGPNAGASFCRGFFMMARPYPTKNAALLDSFLEHKIENERLRKRIAELRREEQEDMEGPLQPQQWQSKPSATTSESASRHNGRTSPDDTQMTPAAQNDYNGMPPPAKPTVSNTALTRQNLDEALASSRPDSINDKMARYEGTTHLETIEMLTGLRYRDGERAKGISTGSQSPTLIRGDAGIPIQVDKDGRPTQSSRGYSGSPYSDGINSEKKKKLKVADEYVCTDCGTLDSPEWRKGPSGPKTLCNACGLRWAKKEKKRSGHFPDNGSAATPSAQMGGTPTPRLPSSTSPQQQAQGMQPTTGTQLAPSMGLAPAPPAPP